MACLVSLNWRDLEIKLGSIGLFLFFSKLEIFEKRKMKKNVYNDKYSSGIYISYRLNIKVYAVLYI